MAIFPYWAERSDALPFSFQKLIFGTNFPTVLLNFKCKSQILWQFSLTCGQATRNYTKMCPAGSLPSKSARCCGQGPNLSETFSFFRKYWLHWQVRKCPTILTPEAVKQLELCRKNIWKIDLPNHKRDTATRWCICNMPSRQSVNFAEVHG